MAKNTFETPEVRTFPVIPKLEDSATSHLAPFKSKEEFQTSLGYPGELVDNWQEKAIDKMGDLLGKYRSLRVYLDSCIQCGACTDKCHYYQGTKDPKNMPVGRQNLIVYFSLIFVTIWVVLNRKSSLIWRVFKSLPIPPDELKKDLNYFYYFQK